MNKNQYNPIVFVTSVNTKKHLLGIKNPDIGIFYGTGFDGKWKHIGFPSGRVSSITIDESTNGKIIYAACGNGIIKSIDYGRTWKMITDHTMTEVLRIAIDPKNPKTLYAATAYGVFKSIDSGKTWKEKNKGKHTLFCSQIVFDLSDSKKILIACEDGIFISINKGETWSLCALGGKGIRTILQHPVDTDIFITGTEDDGIFISTDHCKSFSQKNNGLNHKTIYAITADSNNKNVLYCGTYLGGIYKTEDLGESWKQINNGLKEMNVHALAIHPNNSNIIFAGSLNDGLLRSNDGGMNWENISGEELDQSQIWNINIFKEKLYNPKPKTKILNKKYQQFKYDPNYKVRRGFVFEFLSENFSTSGIFSSLAKIILGKDVEKAYQEIDDVIDSGRVQAMFLAHQMITSYLYCKDFLPERLKNKIRDVFKHRMLYRGDTENHWLLYYVSMYLAAETWPNEDGSNWFNGKSSKENLKESKAWIDFWMNTTTTIGQGEFDSPTYHPTFLVALYVLYDFAKDKILKHRAQIMLDYLLADFAVEHLKGFYCGGHSRDYPIPPNITDPRTSPITSWAYLLFGQTKFPFEARDFGLLFLPIMSNYQMPEVIYRIATDRDTPYIHKEKKRVRNIFRFSTVKNPPVFKYIYMTKDYAIGSLHGGGVLQPIQQHNWDVTFMSDKPHNTIFCLHPYADPTELGMFFPDELKLMVDEVHKFHKIYKSPDKWASGSPYEQIFQYKNAIIVLHNIPKGVLYEEIDAHFPKTLDERICHDSGWIICREGKTFIAYYPFKPYNWIDEEDYLRLRSEYIKNGCIMEVASEDDFIGENAFEQFKDKIIARKIDLSNFDNDLTVHYTTINGDKLIFTYAGDRIVNDHIIDLNKYKLFEGPFLNAEVGSGKLKITYKNMVRILDLKKNQIIEFKEKVRK